MTGIALGGLASGLDTNTIISQLIAADSGPLNALKVTEQQDLSIQTQLQNISTKVKTLRDAAASLGSLINWLPQQTAESSAPTIAAARTIGTASSGAYSVDVTRLAQTAQQSYGWTPPAAGGTITIALTGDPTKTATIALNAGASAQDAADAINASTDSPVSAAVVTQGGVDRLVLTSRTSGNPGEFSVTDDSTGNPLAGLLTSRAGQDASVTIDGDTYTSSTNVLSNAISGVELTLKSTGTTTVTASTPATNPDTIVDAVKAFVTAYNDVVKTIRDATTQERVASPQTTDDQLQGLLHGDSALNGLLNQLRSAVSTTVGGSGSITMLADIGISTGETTGSGTLSQDALAGYLSFDEDKLRDALDTDPDAVKSLLGTTGGGTGFVKAMTDVLVPQTQAGGLLDQRLSSIADEIADVRDNEATMQDRLDQQQQRLQAQFTAMETALSQAQSQSQWLQSQIAGLMG